MNHHIPAPRARRADHTRGTDHSTHPTDHTHRTRTTFAVATLALATLTLTACGPGDDEPTTDQAASANPDAGLEDLVAADARPDQRGAGAGANMAYQLGFDQQISASEQEIAAARDDAQDRADTDDITVDPANCADPLATLDWSPILTDTDEATRVDFGAATFNGTGSIEVSTDAEPEAYEEYLDAVTTLSTDCNELTVTIGDADARFTAETLDTETVSDDTDTDVTGLLWSRTPVNPTDNSSPVTALVLTTEFHDHHVMVSFVGDSSVREAEFQEMSEAILSGVVEELR